MRKTGAALLVAAVALASGLAACHGSADDEPPPAATETAPQAAVPAAPSPAETPQPPAPPEAPVPEPPAEPVEPDAPAASPPTGEPTTTASEEAPAPVAEPPPLLYDTYDLSGAVTEPGHYAFLADPEDPASVVTTYEELRDGTTTALLVHKADGYGASQAALYDAVEPGDLFEWRQADDCFVRYQVTEVQPDPTGTAPQKLLGVAWMTYAFTGCSGAVDTTTAATLDWGDLPDLGGTSLTAPVVHGVTQIVPENWTGATMAPDLRGDPSGPPPFVYTTDLATARTLPYWREPRLPTGWTFERAEGGPGSLYASVFGYCAWYRHENVGVIEICGSYVRDALWPIREASWGDGRSAAETRVVNGRPVTLLYSPPGPNHLSTHSIVAWIDDPSTNTGYGLIGGGSLKGSNVDAVLEVLGSLFESPNPQ